MTWCEQRRWHAGVSAGECLRGSRRSAQQSASSITHPQVSVQHHALTPASNAALSWLRLVA
eukprot:721201-Rhodomonas_salina.1